MYAEMWPSGKLTGHRKFNALCRDNDGDVCLELGGWDGAAFGIFPSNAGLCSPNSVGRSVDTVRYAF